MELHNLIERFGLRRASAYAAESGGNGDEEETTVDNGDNGDDTKTDDTPSTEGDDAKTDDTPEGDDGTATNDADDALDADDADGSDDAGDAGEADAGDPGAADPAEVVNLCNEVGRPELAEVLIREKATAENVLVRLDRAQQIVAAVTMARKVCPAIDTAEADPLIAANATPRHAKIVLFDKIIAAQSPEISNKMQPGNRPAGVADEHGWDGIVADYNAKQKRRG